MKARIREANGQAQQGQFNRRESDREGLLL